ncbi:MAG: hypothetical protein SPL31_10230 [Succinivibrio sp.]|nr:hypothetical protein [Succinivibrio sp.]
MFCLNHRIIINGELAGEVNLIFRNLHSAQSRMHKILTILQEELWASPVEEKLSAWIQADNEFNQEESHELMITEM